jgi:hypothetical protein
VAENKNKAKIEKLDKAALKLAAETEASGNKEFASLVRAEVAKNQKEQGNRACCARTPLGVADRSAGRTPSRVTS